MTDSAVRTDGATLGLPGGVTVRFMRTLRLPERGTHDLPLGLGVFPVRRVADHVAPSDGFRFCVRLPLRAKVAVMRCVHG